MDNPTKPLHNSKLNTATDGSAPIESANVLVPVLHATHFSEDKEVPTAVEVVFKTPLKLEVSRSTTQLMNNGPRTMTKTLTPEEKRYCLHGTYNNKSIFSSPFFNITLSIFRQVEKVPHVCSRFRRSPSS